MQEEQVMANQAESSTMGGAAPESAHADLAAHGSFEGRPASYPSGGAVQTVAGHAGPYPPFHGRKVSWVAVTLVMAGFLVGGLAMVFGTGGPIWWLFWTGAGVAVLGLLIAVTTNIFEDWY
jgi:hypothetical protein